MSFVHFSGDGLSADMRAKVIETIYRIQKAGKPLGLLTGDTALQKMAMKAGINFLALGVDAGILQDSLNRFSLRP